MSLTVCTSWVREAPSGSRAKEDFIICDTCFAKYNQQSRESCMEHTTYHNKIVELKKKYGIYVTEGEYKAIEAKAHKVLNESNDEQELLNAASQLVIAAYSRHALLCLRQQIKVTSYSEYVSEWVNCNIHIFPEKIRESISEIYKGSKSKWVILHPLKPLELEEDDE